MAVTARDFVIYFSSVLEMRGFGDFAVRSLRRYDGQWTRGAVSVLYRLADGEGPGDSNNCDD